MATVVLRQTGGIDRRARNDGGRRRPSTNALRDSRPLQTYQGGPRGAWGRYKARELAMGPGVDNWSRLKSRKTRLIE